MKPLLFTTLAFTLCSGLLPAADTTKEAASKKAESTEAKKGWPEPAKVAEAMHRAIAAMRKVSFAGGYAWHWPVDLSTAHGENHSSPSLIMIQPPGTPAMGLTFLQAYRASGDKLALQAAREAAKSLLWCQMATGGWGSDYDFDPRRASRLHYRRDVEAGDTEAQGRANDSTLDDQKTQTAMLFLLELAHTQEFKDDKELRAALDFGLKGLLAAQYPNGGWPQHYRGPADPKTPVVPAKVDPNWPHIWPNVDYTGFYTLNDNNIHEVMKLLLRAHHLEKDERFLAAARKTGEFLLLARLPEPQPVWAQQYNEKMEPVWARKFEPPAASSLESFGALEALFELWVATGEARWLEPMKPVMAWLEKVRLKDGQWARFYELGTDKPLYCKAKTYELTYDDSDLPTHYGFKLEPKLEEGMAKMKTALATPREELLAKREGPQTPKKWASQAKGAEAKVQTALSTQDKKGWWLEKEEIDAGLFVKHVRAMSTYLEAAAKGGEEFTKMLKANQVKTEEAPARKP